MPIIGMSMTNNKMTFSNTFVRKSTFSIFERYLFFKLIASSSSSSVFTLMEGFCIFFTVAGSEIPESTVAGSEIPESGVFFTGSTTGECSITSDVPFGTITHTV